MIKGLMGAAAGLLLVQGAVAEPAIFRDDTLWIPHGAAVLEEGVFYHNDIFFDNTGDELVLQSSDPGLSRGGPWLEDEGAIYADGELWIDNAAVIPGDASGTYYSEVVLEQNEDGSFVVSTLTQASQPIVDETSVTGTVEGAAGRYAVVEVEGRLSTPCHFLLEPAVSVNENTNFITVMVAESDGTSDLAEQPQVCAQVLEPFTRSMFLPVSGLESGSWEISVNGRAPISVEL